MTVEASGNRQEVRDINRFISWDFAKLLIKINVLLYIQYYFGETQLILSLAYKVYIWKQFLICILSDFPNSLPSLNHLCFEVHNLAGVCSQGWARWRWTEISQLKSTSVFTVPTIVSHSSSILRRCETRRINRERRPVDEISAHSKLCPQREKRSSFSLSSVGPETKPSACHSCFVGERREKHRFYYVWLNKPRLDTERAEQKPFPAQRQSL